MNNLYAVTGFAAACMGTILITPLIKKLAAWAGAMDRPNARKVHKVPTPLWGGLGVFVSIVSAVLLVLGLFPELRESLTPKLVDNLQGMFLASCMIVAIGMIDDRYNMPAKVKLVGQIATAAVIIWHGIRIDYLSIPGAGIYYLYDWQSFALTAFWIVGLTNAINLLDGLDGLVAGVALGSSTVFMIVASVHQQWLAVLVMASIAGAALGFLRYNFNPASIFMGDTGSLLIGLNFAGWSIVGLLKTTVSLALAIPILVMAVPIFDTAFAICRRALARRPIFGADKEHLHHRLLGLGLTQKQAVLSIYALNLMFGLAGLALAYSTR